jgi:hypothetical protein
MSNYTKATNFTAKDGLPAGNSSKVVKGVELDTEFTAISAAISSKSDSNSPTFTGTPLAPTANAGTNNTQIATTAFATAAAAAAFPVGGIIMWSGSVASIPSGWALCNGSNGTPDLRNRFVVGAGSTYAVDATGGSTTTTATGSISGSTAGTALTEAQMPKHFHALRGASGPFTSTVPSATASGSGNYGGGTPDDGTAGYGTNSTGGNSASGSSGTGTSNGDSHTHGTGTLAFTGNAVTSLPPYYALCFIQKL